jgi:hypothetical protein
MMIVNDDSRVVNKLEASLTDDTRVIIYDCHMFIVQATDFRYSDKLTNIGLFIEMFVVVPSWLIDHLHW